MMPLISRLCHAAAFSFADASIVLTVTGSIPATLAVLFGSRLLSFSRK